MDEIRSHQFETMVVDFATIHSISLGEAIRSPDRRYLTGSGRQASLGSRDLTFWCASWVPRILVMAIGVLFWLV